MSKTVFQGFRACIKDLLRCGDVLALRDLRQHGRVSRLEHSLLVSYISYRVCRRLGWNSAAAARGGLLHDLYLYNPRRDKGYKNHLSAHPKTALKNAEKLCRLSDLERDIILKHMWPLTRGAPKFKETLVVNITDTICAIAEGFAIHKYIPASKEIRKLCGEAR